VSIRFLIGLAIIVAIVVGARFLSAVLPLRRLARPIAFRDAVLVGVGVVGLTFHCGAMFFRRVVEVLPGTGPVIGDIRALGTASVIWYVVPAALVLFGLRRLHPVGLAVVALALGAVGITMYNGGSLDVHLAAIFVSVVLLVGAVAALVQGPSRRTPAVS